MSFWIKRWKITARARCPKLRSRQKESGLLNAVIFKFDFEILNENLSAYLPAF